MDKKVKETLVGVFIVVGLVLSVILYIWLTGRIGMRNTRDVKVYFVDVGGLRIGDPVLVYGIEKGKIKSLKIEAGQVLVILSISRDIPLPEDSKFVIRSVSALGGDRYIKIAPGSSNKEGAVFNGTSESLDLESIAGELSKLMKTFDNLKLPDLNVVGDKLSAVIDKNVKNLSSILQQPGDKLSALIQRLDSISVMLQGEGTMGKLLKSDELYQEIRETNQSVKELVDDIKTNPKRYINLKDIKIF